ncbi:MAG: amidohydrolase family protein, partial [Saprospiraceae bacterium]|nr:amidohydrolase family protein [Saprospiraceae bacterium]
MHTVIKGGRILDPENRIDEIADLYIIDDRIAGIGTTPEGFKAEVVIEARDKLVIPGLVDLSARLREPGAEYKATIDTETRAAARGGITSICCPPDTVPVIDTPAVAELIHKRAQSAGMAKVYCLGALTEGLHGETLACMHALRNAGCTGMSNAYNPVRNNAVLRQSLEYASTFGKTVHLYCEDVALRGKGVVHEGIMSARLGLAGIPDTAETIAVSSALLLVEQTGARVHFCRISSAGSVNLIAAARQRGLAVTADVAIANLYLTEIDLDGFNSQFHMRPPLRTDSDRAALRQALANGVIDAICSDHQPHDEDAKSAPFSQTEPGASTIDVFLSLALQLATSEGLDLPVLLQAIT